jgi:DNA-binding response OmpR family regulator
MMIVDNSPDILELWKYVQGEHDALFLVRGSLSAQKYLNGINYEIDAIVTDIAMEDGDGVTLTEIIRRNESIRGIEKNCLVFWFTGFPITRTLENLKAELGVTEIFMKPMDPIELIGRVKGYLAIGMEQAAA